MKDGLAWTSVAHGLRVPLNGVSTPLGTSTHDDCLIWAGVGNAPIAFCQSLLPRCFSKIHSGAIRTSGLARQ